MAKTVATYSWLARKAMALQKKDPAEYRKLSEGDGTDKLIRGATVRMFGHEHYTNNFTIRVGGKRWCEIYGVKIKGKLHSWYKPWFTTTQYRKRLVEKYMPFSLPDGVRSYYNSLGSRTPCNYHNADGSVAGTGWWDGGRRNRPGRPDKALCICDETGQFDLNAVDGEQYESYESLMHLGWFEEASRTRRDWLESVRQMPHCDTSKVLEVAAKTYLAAARLCERYPRMRMAMFPAGPYQYKAQIRSQWHHHCGTTTVLHRDSSSAPVLWYLPEVLVYWEETGDDPGFVSLSMTIPPHGCPLLDPTGKSGTLSRTARAREEVLGYWNGVPLPLGYECAYHAVQAYKPSTPADERHPLGTPHVCFRHGSTDNQPEAEKWMTVWPKHTNKVVVQVQSKHHSEGDVDLPLPMDVPMAMKPEDVLLAFEEKMLLESLPLC